MNSSKSGTNLFNAIAKNAAQTTTALTNSAAKAANSVVKAANSAVNSTIESVADAATTTANAVGNAVNSLIPLGNSGMKAAANNASTMANNVFTNVFPTTTAAANAINGGKKFPTWGYGILVFLVVTITVTIVMVVYKEQVKTMWGNIKKIFVKEQPVMPVTPVVPATVAATAAPSDIATTGVLSKILPSGSGSREVFNVSSNDFTYYDAEPMCRALGAELATYDQVQDAWKKGADWCNYGWVKGQLAVYPTQKDTFERLQAGNEDDQKACGVPGVNGGFFDNPEMRFGVNCYGVKPAETANDERMLQEKGFLPRTTSTLKVDQQAQEFKERIGSIGVLPFNEKKWSN